jgi:hypothetical protein
MTLRRRSPMTPKHKINEKFAKAVRDWIPIIEQERDLVECKSSEIADKQEHSDGAYNLTPKPRAESGGFGA